MRSGAVVGVNREHGQIAQLAEPSDRPLQNIMAQGGTGHVGQDREREARGARGQLVAAPVRRALYEPGCFEHLEPAMNRRLRLTDKGRQLRQRRRMRSRRDCLQKAKWFE